MAQRFAYSLLRAQVQAWTENGIDYIMVGTDVCKITFAIHKNEAFLIT